jgi:hypothetical protein
MCVLGTSPRTITDLERAALADLAAMVMEYDSSRTKRD